MQTVTLRAAPRPTIAPLSQWSNTGGHVAPLPGNYPATFQSGVMGIASVVLPSVAARPAATHARSPMQSYLIFVSNMAGVSNMAAPRLEPLTAETRVVHPQIDLPTITKTASALVFLVCVFSLLVSVTTGFNVIHPVICVFVLTGAGIFYVMGRLLTNRPTI